MLNQKNIPSYIGLWSIILFACVKAIPSNTFKSLSTILDDVIIVIFLILLFLNFLEKLRLKLTTSMVIMMMVVGVLFAFLSNLNSNTYSIFSQVFKYLKFFTFFIFITHLTERHKKLLLLFLLLYTYVGLMLNIILGDSFYTLYELRNLEGVFGSRLAGFQLAPNIAALILVGLSFSTQIRNKMVTLLFHLLNILLILLTGSTTALLVYLIIFTYSIFQNKNYSTLVLGCFAGVIALTLIGPMIYSKVISTSDKLLLGIESGYARSIILYGAIQLGVLYFPLGAGIASFATPSSRNSSTYEMLGLENTTVVRNFLRGTEVSSGIYDSNAAIYLAEYGFIMSVLLYFLAIRVSFRSVVNTPFWFFSLLLVSISLTKPVFMQFDFFIMLFVLTQIKLRDTDKRLK